MTAHAASLILADVKMVFKNRAEVRLRQNDAYVTKSSRDSVGVSFLLLFSRNASVCSHHDIWGGSLCARLCGDELEEAGR